MSNVQNFFDELKIKTIHNNMHLFMQPDVFVWNLKHAKSSFEERNTHISANIANTTSWASLNYQP